MTDLFLMDQVALRVEACVGGRTLRVEQTIAAAVYEDDLARATIVRAMREQLLRNILEYWKPVVRVRR